MREEIKIKGKNVLAYLYGRSKSIFIPKTYLNSDDLKQIVDGVKKLPTDFKMFGVRLIPAKNNFDIGRRYLALNCDNGSISKRIVKVTNKKKGKLREIISVTQVWPERHKDAKGFFTVMEDDNFAETAYFVYNGSVPIEDKQRKQSFHEHVNELAEDLKLLIELWVYSHFREKLKNSFSFDTPLGLWLSNFPKLNRLAYQHHKVWEIMERILWEDNLYGIETIYTRNNPRYASNWNQVDLITPIMEKLQSDILGKIIQDETLFKGIFFGENGKYMQRRLKVLLEMYYGPRELEFSKTNTEHISDNIFKNKKSMKLALIIELIKRGATEGEKNAAKYVYKRIAGVAYTQ